MDFDVVQAQITARLETASLPDWQGLRMAGTEPGMVLPPVGFLSYPSEIDPHGTYNRGMPRMGMQLSIVVGKPGDRQTPGLLADWARDEGPTSVLAWLEARGWSHPEFSEVTVQLITFDQVSISDTPYAAVLFDLDIA